MFRLMFCVLIALLLPACDQGGPQEANQTPAAPSPEAPKGKGTTLEEFERPSRNRATVTQIMTISLTICP